MTNISGISVLQIIIVFAAVIATTYIANQKDKWKKLSQGIKPLLFGIAGLVIAVLMRGIIDNKINSFDSILNVILLTKQAEYMVGISRIVAISYIALLCGIEILLIVFTKKRIQTKNMKPHITTGSTTDRE